MSVRALNWAWLIQLPPTPHVVLLALADIADNRGFCYPSVPTLAELCVLDVRTVQRVLRKLVAGGYMRIEQRFRPDGSRTSNGYLLNLDMQPPPGKLSPAPGSGVTGEVASAPGGGWQRCHQGGDNGAGVTTNEPSIEPPQQPRDAGPARAETGPAMHGGGSGLCYPKGTSPAMQDTLQARLAGLSHDDAQRILHELAHWMGRSQVRDPARYCERLVERFKKGEFRAAADRAGAKSRQGNTRARDACDAHPDASTPTVDQRSRRMPDSVRKEFAELRMRLTASARDAQQDPNERSPQGAGNHSS